MTNLICPLLSLSRFFSTSFTTNDQFNEKKTLFLLLLLISSNHDHDKINQILFCNLIFRFHCQTNEIHAKKSNEYWSFRYVGDNWWIENVCICYCNCSMYSILPSEQIHFVDWQELMKNMFVHQMQGTNRPSAWLFFFNEKKNKVVWKMSIHDFLVDTRFEKHFRLSNLTISPSLKLTIWEIFNDVHLNVKDF